MKASPFHPAGFTLVEALIGVAISAMLFGAFMSAFMTLQTSFTASYNYAQNTNDQQRMVDYISRDFRRALPVTGSTNSQVLTLTLPDYYGSYDAQGNPNVPILTGSLSNGQIVYSGSQTLTVTYCLSGSSLLRQQVTSSGSSTLVLGVGVTGFQLNFTDPSLKILNFTISFSPSYSRFTSQKFPVTVAATVAMRNAPQ